MVVWTLAQRRGSPAALLHFDGSAPRVDQGPPPNAHISPASQPRAHVQARPRRLPRPVRPGTSARTGSGAGTLCAIQEMSRINASPRESERAAGLANCQERRAGWTGTETLSPLPRFYPEIVCPLARLQRSLLSHAASCFLRPPRAGAQNHTTYSDCTRAPRRHTTPSASACAAATVLPSAARPLMPKSLADS